MIMSDRALALMLFAILVAIAILGAVTSIVLSIGVE